MIIEILCWIVQNMVMFRLRANVMVYYTLTCILHCSGRNKPEGGDRATFKTLCNYSGN